MATLLQPDSKRKYSWWWDSHISPKNSKWLQENLTDMDTKVKQMIRLIEEDADSFARRAEMYYKKRPELMKLVEEFYRAYRALAERYDHATGVIRQAHKSMAEAFPNQVPLVLAEDSPAGSSANETDPQTPEISPIRVIFDPGELKKDALGLSSSHFHASKRNGDFTEEPDTVTSRKGSKQLDESFESGEAVSRAKYSEGKARKGLNFHDAEEKEQSVLNNGSDHIKSRVLSESEQVGKAEAVVLSLKKTLAKLESGKEAGLLQYQQSLERSSALESEVSRVQEDSRGSSQRASQAEAEVQTLKEAVAKLESRREASLLQYQQCIDRIYNLEVEISRAQKDAGELDERVSKAEAEAKSIEQELVRVEGEKEAALAQYKQCSDMISNLEEKLLHLEENARRNNERANKSQTEVETLREELARLTEEREAAALRYQQCLETIANLEHKISHSQEEAQRLTCEIDYGVAKFKAAEERCLLLEKSNQALQSELESLVEKMGFQTEELTEKRKELGRLWTCIQEERLRFVEAETAFQTLQHLHSQSQEELRSLAAELQNRAEILKDMETCNQGLEDEVQRVKEENKSLNELKLSSAVSIKNLQDEVISLRETIGKLEDEVELRVDQRNALQQEIYCLKEELNELNKKHWAVLEQVESVGYDPEYFESSVKELQDENSKLKEICEADRSEKVALLEKLGIMEKLKEKNAVLENSHLDLNVELQGVGEQVKALEESCESLLGEKSTLVAEKATVISQLQIATVNLEKLSEKNNFLENSLSDASAELEVLRVKFKSLEDSCLLLDNEKSGLITERENLVSQLEITKLRLEDLENRFSELEYKHTVLENERESALRKVEELQASLDTAQQEHASLSRLSETRLASMELQIHVLEEEGQCRKKEYEEELDKALSAQIEIFILQRSVHDLEKETISILIECQNLLETSRLSEKLISELEHDNLEQQMEVKSLFGQTKKLRMGLYRVLKTLDIDVDHRFDDNINQDEVLLSHIVCKLQEMQGSFFRSCDENQQLLIEKSVLVTLLGQLKVDAIHLVTERDTLAWEFRIQSDQLSVLQMEIQKILGMNEEFRLKVMEGEHGKEVLKTEIENLHGQLLDLQRANQNLQEDNFKVLEDKRSLIKEAFDLVEEKRNLDEANWVLYGDIMSESNLSLILSNITFEKIVELKKLTEELDKLHSMNNDLEGKVRLMEGKLEDVEDDNFKYKESLNESENELVLLKSISDQLRFEVANGKDLISQKESKLLEAELMFSAITNEKIELHKLVEDLKNKYEEVQVILKDQKKQILKLSAENDHQSQDMGCLREVNLKLESDLCRLHEELGEAKTREESLSSELQKGGDEIALWETQAATSFTELQISSVCEVLFEGRIQELTIACESLENMSISKDIEIELLKERVSSLEGENGGLHAQLAAYTPAVISVKDCISSLEKHTLSNYRQGVAKTPPSLPPISLPIKPYLTDLPIFSPNLNLNPNSRNPFTKSFKIPDPNPPFPLPTILRTISMFSTTPFVLSFSLLLSLPILFLIGPRFLPPRHSSVPIPLTDERDDLSLFNRAASLSSPSSSSFSHLSTNPKLKIAFLFLTNSDLHFSPLWERFFHGNSHLYNIYVHADPSVNVTRPDGVFLDRFISSKRTYRGSPTLISATRRLLATALLDDSANGFFAVLSQYCIPLHSFRYVYHSVVTSTSFDRTESDARSTRFGVRFRYKSFIEILSNEHTLWKRYTARGRFALMPEIPFDKFRVGSQFFVLMRRHALVVIKDRTLWRKFKLPCYRDDECYPEEHYFPTLLSMADPNGCTHYTLTKVNWTGTVNGHPYTYRPAELSPQLIHQLRQSNFSESYLFARKFTPDCLKPLMGIADKVIFRD